MFKVLKEKNIIKQTYTVQWDTLTNTKILDIHTNTKLMLHDGDKH